MPGVPGPPLPPTSSADAPATKTGAQKLPRKQNPIQEQSDILENETMSASPIDNDPKSTNASGISAQGGSSGSASSKLDQVTKGEDGKHSQTMINSPETIPVDLTHDASSEVVDSGSKRTDNTITTTTTTTTTKVEKTGQPTVTTWGETNRPRRDSSTSQSIASQGRYRTQSHSQGGLQKKASFYLDNGSRAVSTTSTAIETRRYAVPSKSSAVIENSLFEIQSCHRQETDHMLAIMKARVEEHQRREVAYEEQFDAFRMDNEELVRRVSASDSEVTMLKIRLSFYEANQPGPPQSGDNLTSTITTTITTVITTITTTTAQIERWKDAVFGNKGQLSITKTDLDRLALDLSSASAQMTKLQQDHDGLSREFTSVRRRLQVTLSLCDEKDRNITFITGEDAAKGQQIIALRNDNNLLRRDLSAASTENDELRERLDTLSAQLGPARKEFGSMKSLIEEKEHSITTLTAQVTELERSNANKTRQITAARQEYTKLEVSSSSEIAELRKRCDVLLKERDSARNELRESKILVEDRDHTITNLNADIEKLKRAGGEQLDAERREKERLQQENAAFHSQIVNLKESLEVHSKEVVSLRNELQIKVTLLAEQEQTITSTTTERDQAKREIARKEELIATLRKDIEQVRQELSTTRLEKADFQRRFDSQLIELNGLRDELDRLNALLKTLGDGAPGGHVADYIRRALEEKQKQIGELRGALDAAASRESDLQKLRDKLSSEVTALNDELKVKTSLYEGAKGTINSLTVQVGQLKPALAERTEELATAQNLARKLELEVKTFTVQLTELQVRYDKQSQEFISVKNEHSSLKLSIQEKDGIISSLTSERNKLAEQTTKLQRELDVTTAQLAELQDSHRKQSDEFASVRREFESAKRSIQDKDREITSLTEELAELKRTNTSNEERLTDVLKQVKDAQQELRSSRSRTAELEHDAELLSQKLASLQQKLDSMKSGENATISSLTRQVEEWKEKYTAIGEELKTACKEREQLRLDLENSTSQSAELEQKLTSQIKRLEQLNATSSANLTTVRNELTTAHAELDTVRAELEQLRRDLSTKITDNEKRYTAQLEELTSQIEQWKRSYATKEEELAIARKKLEELQRTVETSSSKITKFEHDCKAHLAKLQFLQDKVSVMPPDSTVEEWEITKKKILEEVQDYSDVIKLTAVVDEWMGSDAKRAEVLRLELEKRNKENEELRHRLVTLRDIYIHAPRIKQIFHSETIEIKRRYEEESKALKTALADSQSQLRGVQRVVATADTYADETILGALKKLNAEVQQNTTYMAERISEDFRPGTAKLTKEQSQSVSKSIGKAFAKGLASMKQDDVELYLSIAFQAFFSYYLRQAISSWTIEEGHNEFINEIYERLQKGETQPMSGRWRALTRAYISPTWITNSSSIAQEIITELSYIVVAAGCGGSAAAANSKLSSFKDKVLSIITIAGQFSEMIGKTVSADFAVVAPSPLQVYEENTMEEEDVDDGNQGKVAGQKVLCSTQLGMTKRMSGGEMLTVMKTKVVFESFLHG